jgi:DDE superfamily endonuclease
LSERLQRVRLQCGRRLVAPSECPTVPQFQKTKGRLLLIGALELAKNQLTHFYSERKSTDEMVRLLYGLLEQYRNCRKLYLSWDAASWHTSRSLIANIWEVNTNNYRQSHQTPEVQLVPLPAGAQFLNVIEAVFSGMARDDHS